MRRDTWRNSCPDFPDLMSRLSQLKLLARICNLGLKPDAGRPVGRFMSRFSRPYDKTFRSPTLGANVQFGPKCGCSATRGATHDQTFQTSCPDFPDSNSRQESAIWVQIRMRRDPWRDFCPNFSDLFTRLSRLKLSARLCNLGLNPDAARPLARLLSRLSRP